MPHLEQLGHETWLMKQMFESRTTPSTARETGSLNRQYRHISGRRGRTRRPAQVRNFLFEVG